MGRSAIRWYGGKYYMRKEIIAHFPSHKTYIEVFGGAGHVLFGKPLSKIEIFNDIDGYLINFFRVLQDAKKADELKRKLELTPYSRKEFFDSRNLFVVPNALVELDDIELARVWYIALMQSFSGRFGDAWSASKTQCRRGMSQCVSQWLSNIEENIPDVVERLKTVQIENSDFEFILNKYDYEEALFYLDPPYLPEVRSKKEMYVHEMSFEQHETLISCLKNIAGKAVLSGYDNSLYDTLLNYGWRKEVLGNFAIRSDNLHELPQQRLEYVWMNFGKQI